MFWKTTSKNHWIKNDVNFLHNFYYSEKNIFRIFLDDFLEFKEGEWKQTTKEFF